MLPSPNPEGGPDMRSSKQSWGLIGAAALLFCVSASRADEPVSFPECTNKPTPDDVEAAKSLHQIATARLNIQDYDKAIEFWRQAYTLDCTAHPILQNIANAYEKKGDKRSAIAALETYLTRAKDAGDLVKVNERVMELKKSLEPAPTVTATVSAAPTVTVTVAPTATVAPVGPRPYGSIPLIAAGVGGAIAIAGVIMIPVGLGPWNTAQEQCAPPAGHGSGCDVATAEAGNTGRLTVGAGGVFLGVGLAAAAAGLGFHFLFNKPKEGPASAPAKARVDVTPLVGTQFGGMSVSGKF